MNQQLLDKLKIVTPEEQAILSGRKEIDRDIYMDQASMIVDGKKLLDSGKLIQVRPHTRFVAFPTHTHNYVEVIYMCQGSTRHYINGEAVTLREGELLFLNQNATQQIEPAGQEDIAVNFIVLPEFFNQPLQMLGEEENLLRNFIIGCLKDTDSKTSYLHFMVADILPIQNLVENLIWTIMNNQANKRQMNQATMGLLFMQLMNHTDKVKIGEKEYEQDLMLTVLRFIEENYREGQLSELAAKLKVDLYWLSRMIRKMSGKTYTELLQTKRLSQAGYLVTNTKKPITDIMEAVGYDNSTYFHKIFKNRYGMSPKEYRNKHMTV